MARGRHCTTGSWPAGHGGEFVLRIEDTDRERSTPENVEQIFEALRWLGLDWDGEPVFQSERRERHAEVVEQLIAGGHAYRSTAGPERGQGLQGGARRRAASAATTRARAPSGCGCPTRATTVVRDVIRGESDFEQRAAWTTS